MVSQDGLLANQLREDLKRLYMLKPLILNNLNQKKGP